MNDPRAGAPAWLLMITGVMNVLYSVIYAVWTMMPITIVGMAQVSIFLDGTQGLGQATMGFLLLAGVPMIQLIGFCVTAVMGLITFLGGMRLNRYKSKGIVWLGVLCAVGAPLLELVVNAGSALNISAMGLGCITGCLLGNIPTLFTLLFGLIAAIMGVVTLMNPLTTERFAAAARY